MAKNTFFDKKFDIEVFYMEKYELKRLIDKMRKKIGEMEESLALPELQNKLSLYEKQINDPQFWDNTNQAKKILSKQAEIAKKIDGFYEIKKIFDDLQIVYEMLEEVYEESEYHSFLNEWKEFEHFFKHYEISMQMSGTYDNLNAYVHIHPGAGGVDSQDFAQMLLRMYERWAEKHRFKVQILNYQDGDEAGIKTATMLIKGDFVYGLLRSEIGVHRLIRLSPFDSAKRRHTSFASVSVTPEVTDHETVSLQDKDLKIDTYRSSGAGGQSVNTTDSAVRITHIPTGIVVTCQNERSQIQNREVALKILTSKLIQKNEEERLEKMQSLSKKTTIDFGQQIRSYILHPYSMVKDHRTLAETSQVQNVLDGDIDLFIEKYLNSELNKVRDFEE